MNHVRIELENCYGIKHLETDFDFSRGRAYALYAPNGVMKSSLAQTFQDAADEEDSRDRIFPTRKTVRRILDEHGDAIQSERILVVLPYSAEFGINKKTSTLLIDPKLRKEFDNLLRAIDDAKAALLKAVGTQAGSPKRNFEVEISSAFTRSESEFDTALTRIKRELHEQKDAPYASIEYDTIFNDKVLSALDAKDLKNAIEDYIRRYNELLAASTYFRKGTFDYYNAGQIAKSLADNGFFSAKHTVSLHALAGNGGEEITTHEELEGIINREKEAILTDKSLRKKFDDISRQLQKNAELRKFCLYLQNNEALLPQMSNPDKLREEILKSYLKAHQSLYDDWMSKFDAAEKRRKEIEAEARSQVTQWERVIETFNDRFFVPFKLEARNRTQVMLGQEDLINLGFVYVDGAERAEVEKDGLLSALSTGERKALYILNVMFEIETRKKQQLKSVVIVDDIADSFDYQNKYAIIQYLKDISEDGLFNLIVMTHNFDFFRTLESRFIDYSHCLMASKNESGVTLVRASGIKNIFANDWKANFFNDSKKKIASIPFLRNIVEMTTGEGDWRFEKLTAMLHFKEGSDKMTVGELDDVFNSICNDNRQSPNTSELIYDLVLDGAKACSQPGDGLNLENKIVLAIAIRIVAEKFMIAKISDSTLVSKITSNQTQALIKAFKERFGGEHDTLAVLDRVSLMTPENIHVNAFMYEPIIDMSDDHLRKLFTDVSALN